MKKKITPLLLAFICAFICAFGLTACGGNDTVDATGITLSETTLDLAVGEETTLTANVVPNNATDKSVTWSSDKPDFAIVDSNGKVTAIAAGTTVITAEISNGESAQCIVTVKETVNYTVTADEWTAAFALKNFTDNCKIEVKSSTDINENGKTCVIIFADGNVYNETFGQITIIENEKNLMYSYEHDANSNEWSFTSKSITENDLENFYSYMFNEGCLDYYWKEFVKHFAKFSYNATENIYNYTGTDIVYSLYRATETLKNATIIFNDGKITQIAITVTRVNENNETAWIKDGDYFYVFTFSYGGQTVTAPKNVSNA